MALVLVSLIIRAAMLMAVPTPFTIFGYPTVAIVLFLAAFGGRLDGLGRFSRAM